MFEWLEYIMKLLVENVFGLSITSPVGSSLHFFFYDTVKIVILLGIMIFIISYIRSYFPPEKTKMLLEKFPSFIGNIMASLLGAVTPFCSCSSVPLFIGFVEAGIPLGVTFSFLITSPIVNEAAFAVLLGTFGWKIALIYVISGIVVGIVGGIVMGSLKMEKYVEEYVYNIKMGESVIEKLSQKQRLSYSWQQVIDIVKRVWLFLIIGIGIGALIHGYAPENFLAQYADKNNPFAVFIAVVVGVPLYSNAIGTIPIAQALIEKGVAIGTALAFMMATTALSVPEAILLRKVMKPKLLAAFFTVTSIAIIITGYLFNIII